MPNISKHSELIFEICSFIYQIINYLSASQVNMLYILNLLKVMCQLYLNYKKEEHSLVMGKKQETIPSIITLDFIGGITR